MHQTRSRRGYAPKHAARRARVLTFVVLLGSATVSGVASYGGPAATSARAEVPHFAPSPARDAELPSSKASALPGRTDGPAEVGAVAPVSSEPVHLPPRRMSMDEPIQGGLTAHQEQAISARLIKAHKEPKSAPGSEHWTPAMGRTAVARAESWLGMPYSWAGGSASGPTAGRCEANTGGDLDCHVVGFDCSGLMMYAWGPYASLPHLAETQRLAGEFHPTVKQLRPGDMVFFSGYIAGGIGHVAIYTGDGMVIEAPESGSVVKRSKLSDLIASDGVYRGAVRPLTGKTPVVTTPSAVKTTGGTVILRGTDLANVNAVRFDGTVITDFVKHTDTAIVFRAPKHEAGAVALTVSTSWYATSKPVDLTFAKAKPKPRPKSPSPSTSAPSSPKPSSTTPPSKSPTKPAPTKPPTKPAPPTTSSSTTPPAKSSSTPATPAPSTPSTGSSDTTAPAGP